MKRRPRMLLKLGMLLLAISAGAIVNVAVAWVLAATAQTGDWTVYTLNSTYPLLAESRFGWPARSLVNDPAPELGVARRYAIDVGGKRLPFLPVWPGFAINTTFYAAILWLLFAAPGRIRRWRRTKGGLCPACAYPVGESTSCTECGRAIPSPSGRG
ncbi:MAG: hypothetical protein L0Y44_16250 [Phycisphaerales bacterium]|nr:hypothetical protein [Phycisphaerales bacterium]MCI0676268.1 hypothetical protein [Phycisphaerales bacterium]